MIFANEKTKSFLKIKSFLVVLMTDRSKAVFLLLFVLCVALCLLIAGSFMFCSVCCLIIVLSRSCRALVRVRALRGPNCFV